MIKLLEDESFTLHGESECLIIEANDTWIDIFNALCKTSEEKVNFIEVLQVYELMPESLPWNITLEMLRVRAGSRAILRELVNKYCDGF